MVCRKLGLLAALAAFFVAISVVAPTYAGGDPHTLPQDDGAVHFGAASCASSVCHGKAAISQTRRVWLTEFRVWQTKDSHARAFNTLLLPASEDIARKLDIDDASRADVCLDCHSDNVPVTLRGPKFQISDGVGCEACHGGSEQWIASHTSKTTTHLENLEAGMYPTATPDSRAELCLSCHLGNDDKFASHDIMGAGHPQLLFELASYSTNQPMHYRIDTDYIERKGDYTSVDFWLQGMAVSAASTLQLFDAQEINSARIFPELAFYQCDGCHQKTDNSFSRVDTVWSRLPSGSVRLNDTVLRLFIIAAKTLDLQGADEAMKQLDNLVLASSADRNDISTYKAAVADSISELRLNLNSQTLTQSDLLRLRKEFLRLATTDKANYFSYAFGIFLAVNHLNAAIDDQALTEDDILSWFASIEMEASYRPRQFAAIASDFLAR